MPDQGNAQPAQVMRTQRRRASSASVGGAAGASGVGFQNLVFAWLAVPVITEGRLLSAADKRLPVGRVVAVGAQTGFHVDDDAAHTDAGAYLLVQAKLGLRMSDKVTSPLAEALVQVVNEYLRGQVPDGDNGTRPFDPLRDALALCTDENAPSTVTRDLAEAFTIFGAQPRGAGLHFGLTHAQITALDTALGHVRRIWVEGKDRDEPDTEQLRQFVRGVRVLRLDLGDGGRDRAAATSLLSASVPDGVDADRVWEVLVAEGQTAAQERTWRDRADLVAALAHRDIYLGPPSRFADDVRTLRDLTQTNLQVLHTGAQLPVTGGLHISRPLPGPLATTDTRGNILIVGDAGSGKSSLAMDFADQRAKVEDVVVLRADDLAGPNALTTREPLVSVLRAWDGQPGLLLIDGLDTLRGAADRDHLTQIVAALDGSRWQIVATVRTFDARNNNSLRMWFPPRPTPGATGEAAVDASLRSVNHVVVGDLTDAEIAQAEQASPALSAFLSAAPVDLRPVVHSPFYLRIACELANDVTTPRPQDGREKNGQAADTVVRLEDVAEVRSVRSRVDLLDRYWQHRVLGFGQEARTGLLERLCRAMVAQRTLQVPTGEPVVLATDSSTIDELLSASVLTAHTGPLLSTPRLLSFSHNLLHDYAVAIYVLYGTGENQHLVDALTADPALALVARPSLEILAELLWAHRHDGLFWPACFALLDLPESLSSLAFTTRVLNLVHAPDDLLELAPPPGQTTPSQDLTPRQRLVAQVVSAIRVPDLFKDIHPAVPALCALAARLSENTSASYTDAAQATQLILNLHHLDPDTATHPDVAHALVLVLDGCRSDPPRFEPLADVITRVMRDAVETSEPVRSAISRLLTDQGAMQQWGGTVLTRLAQAVAAVASRDVGLARQITRSVLTFSEPREDQVPIGSGTIMPLTHSRREQMKMAVHELSRAFSAICQQDIALATEIFCDVAQGGDWPNTDDRWPLTVADTSGRLGFGSDLSHSAPDFGDETAHALATAIASAAQTPGHVEAVLEILVIRMANASVWATLLEQGIEVEGFAPAVAPLFTSGSLLAHPDTHPPAARLLTAMVTDKSVPAADLETYVLAAIGRIEDTGGSRFRIDVLVACLPEHNIQDQQLRRRRHELPDGENPIPERLPRVTAFFEEWSPITHLRESGITLAEDVEQAARALYPALQAAQAKNGKDAKANQELQWTLTAAKPLFVNAPELLVRYLAEAAAVLAIDPQVQPGTPTGDEVIDLLFSAASSPSAGHRMEGRMMSWSAGLRDTGISGLVGLLARHEWRTPDSPDHVDSAARIVETVRNAIQDENPVVRYHASGAVNLLLADLSAPERVRHLGDLIARESEKVVRTRLLGHLMPDLHRAPDEVKAVLRPLLEALDPDQIDQRDDFVRLCVAILIPLALGSERTYPTEQFQTWTRDLPATGPLLEIVVGILRDYLRPDSPYLTAAFALLNSFMTACAERYDHVVAELAGLSSIDEHQRSNLTACQQLADEVAQEIFFASGAFDQDKTSTSQPELKQTHGAFAELAFPVMLVCGSVSLSPVTHHIVETILFLAPLNQSRALHALRTVITKGSLYATEYMAADLVIPHLNTLLATDRGLVLHDTKGSAAFRHLLDTFVAAGSERAQSLWYTFADIIQ